MTSRVRPARLSPLYFRSGPNTVMPVYIIHNISDEDPTVFYHNGALNVQTIEDSSTHIRMHIADNHMRWTDSEFKALPDYNPISTYVKFLTDKQREWVGLGNELFIVDIHEELLALKWFYTRYGNAPIFENTTAKMLKATGIDIAKWIANKTGNVLGHTSKITLRAANIAGNTTLWAANNAGNRAMRAARYTGTKTVDAASGAATLLGAGMNVGYTLYPG